MDIIEFFVLFISLMEQLIPVPRQGNGTVKLKDLRNYLHHMPGHGRSLSNDLARFRLSKDVRILILRCVGI